MKSDYMIATYEGINLMLNDRKHNFGHGYCLCSAILEYNNF